MNLMSARVAEAVGWTLVHSLWQGAVAGLALFCILLVTRAAWVRYAAACTALFGAAAAFVVTLIGLMPDDARVRFATGLVLPPPPSADAGSLSGLLNGELNGFVLPAWLAPLWLAGALLFQARNCVAWFSATRLRRRGVCAAPDPWRLRLRELQELLGVSAGVRFVESSMVEAPAVVGWLRPVILTPVGMLTAMPTGQVEAILLHELAHVKRRDYLVNILQTAVEGFLFYHPGIWWISSVIRSERENSCDDLVVAARGERL